MEKKKVAIVTLGDSRREFYKKREAIVASEIEKVKKAFGDKYDLYISPIVFDTEDGQNISDEIKRQGIEAVIIHVLSGQLHLWHSALPMELPIRCCC